MGVTGLWKLIEPCGQPIPVEMLENKVLAIDISIWLHQVVKGFQDNKGSALANSHLLGLFHRLCKLMYYRVKPVFIFDGKVPLLKKETIAKRNQKRNKLVNEAERIQNLLLQSLAKEKVVQQALGSKATDELLKASPSKNRTNQRIEEVDIFKLPDLQKVETSANGLESDFFEPSSSSECDTSFDESKPRNNYNQDLQAIDVKSEHFRKLPADIRHEILIDIKETRKQSSWGKLHELPSKSNEFSKFQMKRLLKRRQVQESIEEVEKEMDGGRTLTLSELENIFSEEGIIEAPGLSSAKHISSDASSRYLLIRDLKESLANVASEENKKKLKKFNNSKTQEADVHEGVLEDADLERALKMSLEDSAPYSESDYGYRNEGRKLNREQRLYLKNSGTGLARDYMIEHANMNDEDVKSLLEQTQDEHDFNFHDENIGVSTELLKVETEIKSCIEDSVSLKNKDLETSTIKPVEIPLNDKSKNLESLETLEENDVIGIISDSSSQSDFEEIKDDSISSPYSKKVEILVDPSKKIDRENDMFADVFKPLEEPKIDLKQSSLNVSELFKDLKKQAAEATKINLSDIKLDTTVIDISDSESVHLSQKLEYETDSESTEMGIEEITNKKSVSGLSSVVEKDSFQKEFNSNVEKLPEPNEIIEIVDDNQSKKSSITLTPSKTKDISDFFETKFIIKRTPTKTENFEDVPSVTPPFFIRKSPKGSSEKKINKRSHLHDDDSHLKKSRKINKMLFENKTDNDTSTQQNESSKSEEDTFEVALKTNKSTEELEDMVSQLAREKLHLEKERNRQDRMGMTITEKMNSECMELLRLFGVPFIVAPMEAEAQCAFLDIINLTNGTITDDSDIWLFGGRTVYKNFFAQNKHVMEFKYENIKNSFNVDRNKLIQLALLVGSDYTTGINGIGAVTALEILASFSSKELSEAAPSQQISTVLASLINFREWWTSTKTSSVVGSSVRLRLRNKLANIEVYEEFPSHAVADAYLNPKVDTSKSPFSWGTPNVESIKEFTRTNFGWTRHKTDEILKPVLNKLNQKTSQSTITNYFAIKSISSTKKIAVSKRVQNAINNMSSTAEPNEETNATRKKTNRRKKQIDSTPDDSNAATLPKKSKRISQKIAQLPSISEAIPQRIKGQEEMDQRKKIAAEKLKQSKQRHLKK